MKITKSNLYFASIVLSVAHCITTNQYPLLAYEKSWDNRNHSFNDSCGCRGTITFAENFCVGAIRDENEQVFYLGDKISHLMEDFPKNVSDILLSETLSYLLVDSIDGPTPCVTSVFWCDTSLHYAGSGSDFELFYYATLTEEDCFSEVAEQYGLDEQAVILLKSIVKAKQQDFYQKITLTPQQILQIPDGDIKPECVEALKELNIFLP